MVTNNNDDTSGVFFEQEPTRDPNTRAHNAQNIPQTATPRSSLFDQQGLQQIQREERGSEAPGA